MYFHSTFFSSAGFLGSSFGLASRICLLDLTPFVLFLKLLPAVGHTTFPRNALKMPIGQSRLTSKKEPY